MSTADGRINIVIGLRDMRMENGCNWLINVANGWHWN
jgi:hypothetical protein